MAMSTSVQHTTYAGRVILNPKVTCTAVQPTRTLTPHEREMCLFQPSSQSLEQCLGKVPVKSMYLAFFEKLMIELINHWKKTIPTMPFFVAKQTQKQANKQKNKILNTKKIFFLDISTIQHYCHLGKHSFSPLEKAGDCLQGEWTSQPGQAAVTKRPELVAYKQQTLISHSSSGREFSRCQWDLTARAQRLFSSLHNLLEKDCSASRWKQTRDPLKVSK